MKIGDRVLVKGKPGTCRSDQQGKPGQERRYVRLDSGNAAWFSAADIAEEKPDAQR